MNTGAYIKGFQLYVADCKNNQVKILNMRDKTERILGSLVRLCPYASKSPLPEVAST